MKQCICCKRERDLKCFRPRVKKSGEIYIRPTCHACSSKKNKDKNRELYNQKARENYAKLSPERKEELKQRAYEWRKNNLQKSRETVRKSIQKKLQDPIRKEEYNQKQRITWNMHRKTLSDQYIVCLLVTKYERGIVYKNDIPPEVIEAKRNSLILKREIRKSCLQ